MSADRHTDARDAPAAPHPGLLIGRRGGSPPLTYERLLEARAAAARIVRDHGDAYLPIFERLDNEVRKWNKREDLREKAIALAENRDKSGAQP